MKVLSVVAVVLAGLFLAGQVFAMCGMCEGHSAAKQGETKAESAKEVYACLMHPEVKMNEPGFCSKCGMKLENQGASEEEATPKPGSESQHKH